MFGVTPPPLRVMSYWVTGLPPTLAGPHSSDPVTRSCESTWGLALKALLQSAMFRLTVEAAGPGSRVALSVSSLNRKLQHRTRPAFTHL